MMAQEQLGLSPGQRAQRLLAEARAAAREHVDDLEIAMEAAARLSTQIAEGGDIYPAGVRDLCRRLADEAGARRQSLNALAVRLLPGLGARA
jgi:hypothetical protein